MAPPRTRSAHKGPDSLVIAIDVGTTYSGASFVFLRRGQVPKIRNVTKFRGQDRRRESARVPSVLVYDEQGRLKHCGAQVAEDEVLAKTIWFKLLLLPPEMRNGVELPTEVKLPPGVQVVQVLADFLRYMYECIEEYVRERSTSDEGAWNLLEGSATIILSHPNGWEGAQRDAMRTAAVLARLIPDTPEGRARIAFVSEGEASFHWCVDTGLVGNVMNAGCDIVVVDAGGGTIDVSSYRVTSRSPLRLKETATAACEVEGSVRVTERFGQLVKGILEATEYSDARFINAATKRFDETTKPRFEKVDDMYRIELGDRKCHAPENGIRAGQLSIPGAVIAEVFAPSCVAAASAVTAQLGRNKNVHVFLVGGFGASNFLLSEMKKMLPAIARNIKNNSSFQGKAVPHGAIAFHLDQLVKSRVAKHTLGIATSWELDLADPEHRKRLSTVRPGPDGTPMVPGGFQVLIRQGESIQDNAQYKDNFAMIQSFFNLPHPMMMALDQDPITAQLTLQRYTGSNKEIKFYDMDKDDKFQDVCTFEGTANWKVAIPCVGPRGPYRVFPYTVNLSLGKTEVKCHLEWEEEEGETISGPAVSRWEDI